ncbi:putative 1-phosphatidylinositol phosphodiesterase [Diaporthe ampelina]|uniref:Putative 1-phosphatidylinositol phosphodiesterase n=1 Tax=Diaporthe ampelina TaxID=1214573 RepID=A0A0G2FAG6_9PEZI|nr:putative 1-phosphatidylinositol phosphodiesterase [Diaporthe ampelina]
MVSLKAPKHTGRSSRSRSPNPGPEMASLTIRNVTVSPLELVLAERFERGPAHHAGGFSRITGLFTSSATTPALFTPAEGQEPSERLDVDGVVVGAFETRATDIRPPEPGRSVLRLTFRAAAHRYVVDLPSPGARSVVMRRVKEGEDGGEGDDNATATATTTTPPELTTVYTPSAHHLTVLSSANLSRWMRELGDAWPLSALSVPGTHNSPTCHVALPSVRCQAVGVREQLDNGVRFLDVRVSASRGDGNDSLALVHSVFPVSLGGNRYLAGLLDELYAFLDDNPSEALIISLKREGTGRGTDQHLSQHLFRRYCGGGGGGGGGKAEGEDEGDNKDTAAARRWFTEPRIPSLGEARGKIVLVRRFNNDDALQAEHGGRGWGIDAAAWPDNCADGTVGSGLVRVQDLYEVGQSAGIDKKAEVARSHLERAGQQVFAAAPAPPPPFFVNFLTASNFFNASCWPEKIAAKVNPSIVEYLCVRHAEKGKGPAQLDVGDAGTGIVVTDWVGHDGDWDLIRCIVAWNARLQLK